MKHDAEQLLDPCAPFDWSIVAPAQDETALVAIAVELDRLRAEGRCVVAGGEA